LVILAYNGMVTEDDQHSQLRQILELVADPRVDSNDRRAAESRLEAHSPVAAQNASTAVQSLDVTNDRDSQLYWYYINSLQRHAGRLYWKLDNVAKLKLLNVCFTQFCAPHTPVALLRRTLRIRLY
jgi:hypothetical protein